MNYLYRVVAKLSKSERKFIKELRTLSMPRILRVVPPSNEETDFFDFYSMIYMFEFADIINLNMRCLAENDPNYNGSPNSDSSSDKRSNYVCSHLHYLQ